MWLFIKLDYCKVIAIGGEALYNSFNLLSLDKEKGLG